MTAAERHLAELSKALAVRGKARRRFLRECRDHLADAAAEVGEEEAVRRFGPPAEVAAAFDLEVAAGRGLRSTAVTAAAVLATGGSTLALIHAATPGATAPAGWAVVFFVAAQLAAVAAALAVVQALALRRAPAAPGDVRLLARRNACAVAAAAATMFAAGAALPGHGSAALLLAGPLLLLAAAAGVLRTGRLSRRIAGATGVPVRAPLDDLRRLTCLALPSLSAWQLLTLTAWLAAAAAFVRDRAEHASVGGALITAGLEAVAVVACFVVLGPTLGLWRRAAGQRA